MANDCLFCKIIDGSIPATIIDQSHDALAFRDISPQAPTHILVIPKIHITSTRELTDENSNYLLKVMKLAQKISETEGIKKTGFRWVINTGDDGGQTIDHLHLHLLGGRQMIWPPG